MRQYVAESLSEKKYLLGEGPMYDEKNDIISWVDIVDGKFYRMEAGKIRSMQFDEMIGAAVLDENGGYIICGEKGIYRLDTENKTELIYDLTSLLKEGFRCNDAKLDPVGRLFFGVIPKVGHEHGTLYCLENGQVRVLQDDTITANGMAWTKDKKHFYFSESGRQQVFVYDYDVASGDITNRKPLFEIKDGVPDGMTIDAEDNLWVAVWGGRRVEHRDGKTGELLDVINVPADHVSSCTFCDKEKTKLFITTAGDGLNGEQDGQVFRCDLK